MAEFIRGWSRRAATGSLALSGVILLAACAPEVDRTPELPPPPAAFRETGSPVSQVPDVFQVADVPPRGEWWRVFADPVLDDLVLRADRGNWDIRLAAARLAQARAAARFVSANQLPRLGASLSASRQDGPLTNAAGTSGSLFVAGVNLSYELDLFGRLARESAAASLDAEATEALLRAARLLVQADVAQAYYALRAVDAERALVRGAAASQRETSRLTQGMVKSGLAAELTMVRLQAETEALSAEALTLDRRRAELEHAIALLVGETASSFRIAVAEDTAGLPVVPPGIPGTALARRPDVAAARQAMLAAQKRVGVARDGWLPSLTLTGAGGFASAAVNTLLLGSSLLGSSGTTALGALLALPLFDGGRHAATVDKANADLDAVLAQYAQGILTAVKDVEDQLSALRVLAEQDRVLKSATAAARRTTDLVASNYRNGLASQLELLDAQRNELRNRREALRVRGARFQATVGLVRALGGGWGGLPVTGGR